MSNAEVTAVMLLDLLSVDTLGRGPVADRIVPDTELAWLVDREEQSAIRWADLGRPQEAVADWRRCKQLNNARAKAVR